MLCVYVEARIVCVYIMSVDANDMYMYVNKRVEITQRRIARKKIDVLVYMLCDLILLPAPITHPSGLL